MNRYATNIALLEDLYLILAEYNRTLEI